MASLVVSPCGRHSSPRPICQPYWQPNKKNWSNLNRMQLNRIGIYSICLINEVKLQKLNSWDHLQVCSFYQPHKESPKCAWFGRKETSDRSKSLANSTERPGSLLLKSMRRPTHAHGRPCYPWPLSHGCQRSYWCAQELHRKNGCGGRWLWQFDSFHIDCLGCSFCIPSFIFCWKQDATRKESNIKILNLNI